MKEIDGTNISKDCLNNIHASKTFTSIRFVEIKQFLEKTIRQFKKEFSHELKNGAYLFYKIDLDMV